jgi:hypothetical protein
LKIVDSKTGETVAKFAYNEKVKWRIIEWGWYHESF